MIFFIPSNLVGVSLELSFWILKNTSYLLYSGFKYAVVNPLFYNKESENTDEDIKDSVIIIENEELLEKLENIQKLLEENNT